MSSKFPEIWFRGIKDEKEKAELENALKYHQVIQRLIEIVEGLAREVDTPSRKDYDNPSWAYKQAHFNGETIAYNRILELLRPKG